MKCEKCTLTEKEKLLIDCEECLRNEINVENINLFCGKYNENKIEK